MTRLRYSDRKLLADSGSLGDLAHNTVSPDLATAMRVLIQSASPVVKTRFLNDLSAACTQHLAVEQPWFEVVTEGAADPFLDFTEIAAEIARQDVDLIDHERGLRLRSMLPGFEERVNEMFARFRFGYRIENGEIRKVGSPALEEAIIGPALLAIQRRGWEEVERSYREAISHQRAGETDDALTAASSAVEAALKAIGMRGATLKELARSFKGSGLVPGYLSNVPELLEDLLDRLHAARSQEGDAHGKSPGSPDPAQALADLAVHWAGSFIVFLGEIVS